MTLRWLCVWQLVLGLIASVNCGTNKVDEGSQQRAKELHAEGVILFQQQRLEEAFKKFKSAAFFDPYNPEHSNDMGMCQMELGHYDAALDSFNSAISLKPETPLYHMHTGMAYLKLQKLDKAEAAFRAAVDHDPAFQDGWLRLGMVYLDASKKAEAQKAWDTGSSVKADAEYESTVGAYLVEKGNFESGGERFARAIQIDPKFAQAHFNLGVVLQRKGDLKTAAEEYEKTVALEPRNFMPYYNLAVVQTSLGKKDLAEKALKKFLELLPPNYPTQRYDAEQRLRDLKNK